jgi:hypothetical protein
MRKLERSRTEDQYIKEERVCNKYLYYTTTTKDATLYYIFKCETIMSNSPVKYGCSRCYCFLVPKDNSCKCFLYDNYKHITLPPNTNLYEVTFGEYVDTFRVFVENDGKYPSELPSKIIQDK